VLTFDPAAGYNGHPDHRTAGQVATEAVHAALDSAFGPELGAPHRTKQLGYLLAPARAFSIVGGRELRAAVAAQPQANLSVPVDRSLRLLGWRIHASQRLEKASPVPGWFLFDFWDKEHYLIFDPSERTSRIQ
jgi:LmbE family N-acetylglucosaminyl deacetylase